MFFSHPLWLIGLLPWAVLAALLLLSRRPSTYVPFLDLWKLNAPQESIRRSFSTPPIGVLLALLATLLAILAAAGPAVRRPGASTVTVIVDTGGSMSVAAGDRTRFAATADRLATLLKDDGIDVVELLAVPGSAGRSVTPTVRTSTDALAGAVAALPPSAVETSATLARVVAQSLQDPAARVVVVTDQPVPVLSGDAGTGRAVRFAPDSPGGGNVGIRRLAVRQTPAPQAMVQVQRTGDIAGPGALTLQVSAAGQSVRQTIDVPAGQTREFFLPLPAAGDVVTAELLAPDGTALVDAFAGDNRTDVVAERTWPIIQPAVPVGELQRLIDIYAAARPSGERSATVRLVLSAPQLGESPGVLLPALAGLTARTRVSRTADHPAVADVDLSSVALPAAVDRTLPPGQWQPVLSDEAGPLLAVRQLTGPTGEALARQAWTAVDPRGWADQVAYVVFWSTLFDWVGSATVDGETAIDSQGGDRLTAWPLQSLDDDWTPVERAPGGERAVYWPGIYQRRGDGLRRAFGPAVVATTDAETARLNAGGDPDASADPIRRLLREGARQATWSPWLLTGAIALTGAAAMLWRRRQRYIVHP